jgi:hypothetical protein
MAFQSNFFFDSTENTKKLRASHLLGRYSTTRATQPVLFCVGYFQDRFPKTVCRLQTSIILISAWGVARITGVSLGAGPEQLFLKNFYFIHM